MTSALARLRRAWVEFWFPPGGELRLAVCRILVVAAQLFVFFPSLGRHLELLSSAAGFIDTQVFLRAVLAVVPAAALLDPQTFTAIYWLTMAAGFLCLVGLATRVSAFLFATGSWFFVAHDYSYGEEHHTEAILCIFLMALAFSPAGRRLSLDALLRRRGSREAPGPTDTAMWPLRLVQVLLAYSYCSTGLAKLLYGGWEWLNGWTLQRYIFGPSADGSLPLGRWLAPQHELVILLSVGTILFELFFFLALVIPRTAPFFVVGGTLFHLGIFYTMGAPFFSHIVLYSAFIDFDHLAPRVKGLFARRRPGEDEAGRPRAEVMPAARGRTQVLHPGASGRAAGSRE